MPRAFTSRVLQLVGHQKAMPRQTFYLWWLRHQFIGLLCFAPSKLHRESDAKHNNGALGNDRLCRISRIRLESSCSPRVVQLGLGSLRLCSSFGPGLRKPSALLFLGTMGFEPSLRGTAHFCCTVGGIATISSTRRDVTKKEPRLSSKLFFFAILSSV